MSGGAAGGGHRAHGVRQRAGLADVPVTGMRRFVDADWPPIGGALRLDGMHVLWPRKAAALVAAAGSLGEDELTGVMGALAGAFPAA